ncbi:MAG: hypothetical protein ACTSWL_06835 [Promethearchaeota archaeon]
METELWNELVQNFDKAISESIKKIEERDVETIPGARDQLIRRFEELKRYLPRNNGELLIKSIDDSIQNAYFPRVNSVSEAFNKVLNTLAQQHENSFVINELINGFIAGKAKSFGSYKEGAVIDKIIEAFKKSKDFRISDYRLFAMFSNNPNKPRPSTVKQIEKIADFIGLVCEERVYARDLARSEEKIVKFYTFPKEILEILEGKYIIQTDKGETIINEEFDKNVFTALFLAKYAVDRSNLDVYKVNGICAIFSLILILSFMPKVKLGENSPILRDPNYNADTMSVIPKTWMRKDILLELIQPTIELLAYRLGGGTLWFDKIKKSDATKRLHLQSSFLIKDINRWVLGNLCRVEIPIFVEISNIFQEITVSGDSEE